MTTIPPALLVAPVVPQAHSRRRRSQDGTLPTPGHRRVSVPRLAPSRHQTSVYGLAAVDDRGKIAIQYLLRPLGWEPGTRVTIGEHGGFVLVTADSASPTQVLPRGHLRLPAPVRHWCGLGAGSRVLLVADPTHRRLVIHPPTSLDAMVTRLYAEVLDGDPGTTGRTERIEGQEFGGHDETWTEARS